ncbi:MAG: type II secretion system F family protein [Pigmentiphaga sp.]
MSPWFDSLVVVPVWASWLAGGAVGLLVWLVFAAFAERRLERAPRPCPEGLPLWWRMAWPIGQIVGLARWRVSASRRNGQELRERFRLLELPDAANASEWRAARCVLVLAALMAGLPLAMAWGGTGWSLLPAWALLAWLWPAWWLRSALAARQRAAVRALPFMLDMMTLCLEGGLHFQGAVQQAAEKGPPGPLRDELRRWLGDLRAGSSRSEALRALANRLDDPAVRGWVQIMIQADALGMSLGPVLRAQADQRRAERFLRAEKLALQAPVKMLFPLILCIFPCTFLVIAFPVAVRLMEALG